MKREQAQPWDRAVVEHGGAHSLIAIAREGRLVRGFGRVHLTAVDESVLSFVDLALSKQRAIAFVYPAPAGDVSVLLAAQILIQMFLKQADTPSVGIVTADPISANRVWDELRIAALGSRTPVSEVFPCFRVAPDGHSPFGKRRHRGLFVGRSFGAWPVDLVIIDHIAGPVSGDPTLPTVHLFSDPLDPALEALIDSGGLVWGWSPSDVAAIVDIDSTDTPPGLLPFSVAHERLLTIAAPKTSTIHVVQNVEVEQIIRRIRDDLRTLTNLYRPTPPFSVLKGLRVAWHHLTTLTSLPCRPSDFDRFCGIPPIAARATLTFEREIAAWASTLSGDGQEIASVLASDLAELRVALDESGAFLPDLVELGQDGVRSLVVLRTHTASRALLHALGGSPDADRVRNLWVRSIRRLHREGTWERAIIVGMPSRWEWHRLDSGLSSDLHFLILGDNDALTSKRALASLDDARRRWGSPELRDRVWREIVGDDPPQPFTLTEPQHEVLLVAAHEFTPAPDPFAALEPLVLSSPLIVGDEGIEEAVAEEVESGTWVAAVPAVDVETDIGTIVLPAGRIVEVRKVDRILDVRADALEPGVTLLLGRNEGRLGLLEAMAERLQKARPDLFAASLIVGDLQASIRCAFRSSGISRKALYDRMVAQGFDKTYHALRGYVGDGGPLAPRDIADLRRLNDALDLGFTDRRIVEVFTGVRRLRTFRRAAGRALAAAARGAVVSSDLTRVDRETGLSLADLREIVVEATVIAVHPRTGLVPLSEIGRLIRKEEDHVLD